MVMKKELSEMSATMSSREIAELTGKRHSDVLEAIRTMETAWYKITQRKFPLSEYIDSTGRKLPCYKLSKTECLYVATKFNDEARARLVIRWEELENKNMQQLPKTYSEALRELADKAEENERLQLENKEMQPKALFADAVTTSTSEILIGDLAKLIKQNGYDIGAVRLFEWMRKNGYLISRIGSDYNSPTQKSMELGLFRVKETAITHSDGHVTVNKTPKVTGKGQVYFINKFLS